MVTVSLSTKAKMLQERAFGVTHRKPRRACFFRMIEARQRELDGEVYAVPPHTRVKLARSTVVQMKEIAPNRQFSNNHINAFTRHIIPENRIITLTIVRKVETFICFKRGIERKKPIRDAAIHHNE